MKAIAVNTIFIIITTLMFFFFAIVLTFGFIDFFGTEATQMGCGVKLLNYCTFWAVKDFAEGDKPYEWEEKSPEGCDKFLKGVGAKGPSKAQCNPIVK